MERPIPTKEFIREVYSKDFNFIDYTHRSLRETPLDGIYPYIDNNELFAFEAPLWRIRYEDPSFAQFVENSSLYEIFYFVYNNGRGFQWLNSHKSKLDGEDDLTKRLRKKYGELNPYKGRDLKARLERVDPETVLDFKRLIQRKPKSYARDEVEYKYMTNAIDPKEVELVLPREGIINVIFNLLSRYPTEYGPLNLPVRQFSLF